MARRVERGFTLVELLAGLAVGLLVVSAATTFVFGHLRDDRAAWNRSRLIRELRMATDIAADELRRAGHWPDAVPSAWQDGVRVPAAANPYAALAPEAAASDAARFSYAQGAAADDEQVGLRLRGGVVEMMLGNGGGWQALTDAGTVVVTHFTLTPASRPVALPWLCSRPCPAGAPACPPVQWVRSMAIEMRGRAAGDPRITHGAQRVVHLRNDVVAGACPA